MNSQISRPTQSLPEGYQPSSTLDLSKDSRLAILVSLLVTLALIVFGSIFAWLALILRHENGLGVAFSTTNQAVQGMLQIVLVVVSATIFVVVVHEGIHGIGFWRSTGERPKFGFNGITAYAAAPEWYLPRRQYVLVGLAPLAGISLAGVLLLPVVPQALLPFLLIVMAFNAAGSMGDVVMVGWLLSQPRTVLVHDHGSGVTAFVFSMVELVQVEGNGQFLSADPIHHKMKGQDF